MNRLVAKIILLLVVSLTLAFTTPPSPNTEILNQTKWVLERQKSNILIYSQKITLKDGYKTRRLKGHFTINAPKEQVKSYLRKGENIQQWMQGAYHSQSLTQGAQYWQNYIQFNLPWPFDDQDCAVQFESQQLDTTTDLISFHSIPNEVKRKKGFVRMEHFTGYWKLVSQGTSTKVEYTAYTRGERLAPTFIQDPIVIGSFWNSLHAFREKANQ